MSAESAPSSVGVLSYRSVSHGASSCCKAVDYQSISSWKWPTNFAYPEMQISWKDSRQAGYQPMLMEVSIILALEFLATSLRRQYAYLNRKWGLWLLEKQLSWIIGNHSPAPPIQEIIPLLYRDSTFSSSYLEKLQAGFVAYMQMLLKWYVPHHS